MIRSITQRLYSELPRERLYHYTTFEGLRGIIDSGALWTSDVRYMNDSAELRHTADLIRTEADRRIRSGHPTPQLLNRFVDWVAYRITNGHMLFAGSFRANGNLLSQWRGYSTLGKGISVGFNPEYILACTLRQQFEIGRCIYEPAAQRDLIAQVIDAVEALAESNPYKDPLALFTTLEGDLLRLAAILKHPSFREEDEWRVVSPVVSYGNKAGGPDSPVKFREGTSMLVPYVELSLIRAPGRAIEVEHVFLGPTANSELSLNSLNLYLASHGVRPEAGIDYCQIPFRQR